VRVAQPRTQRDDVERLEPIDADRLEEVATCDGDYG